MAYIASCLQELLPFVNDNSLFIQIWQWRGHPIPMDTFLVCLYNVDSLNIYMKDFGSETINFDKMTAMRT